MQRRRSILNIQLKQLRDKQTRKNTLLKLLPQNVVCDEPIKELDHTAIRST